MKRTLWVVLFSVLVFGIFTASQCNKPPLNKVPTFSYLQPIVNPPDTFQIAFNLSSYGDKFAHVTFADSAVWLIERMGDGRAIVRIKHNSGALPILGSDTLGLQANEDYMFVANNNNYNIGNFFIQLTKLPIDYHAFNQKFK